MRRDTTKKKRNQHKGIEMVEPEIIEPEPSSSQRESGSDKVVILTYLLRA